MKPTCFVLLGALGMAAVSAAAPFTFQHHFIDRELPGNSWAQTALADLDKDGRLDYITGQTRGPIYWYRQAPAGRWTRLKLGDNSPSDVGGAVLDVDGDGWQDFVAGGAWYRNSGRLAAPKSGEGGPLAEPFERIVFDKDLTAVHDLVVADVDGDKRPDILTMSDKNNLRWYRIPQNPREPWVRQDIGPAVHAGIGVGDLDGDGDLDVARSDRWFENADGKGARWATHENIPFGNPKQPYPLATHCVALDLDRDGDQDLVMTENEIKGGRIGWLENLDGKGGAWKLHGLPQGDAPARGAYHSLIVADFDNDGDPDVFSCEMEGIPGDRPPRWFIWENRDGKGGRFVEHVILEANLGGHLVVAGDVDGDGDLDLVGKLWRPRKDNANEGRNHVDLLENLLVTKAVAAKPNLLFLLADDLGYGDLGCYGGTARTPNIDRLAREGVRFTQFYANGPECSPTRAAFLTGRYQHRVGGFECAIGTGNVGRYDEAIRLRARNELGLPATVNSIARLLQQAGYATALVGKWHLGYDEAFAPNRHGFDHAFYCLGGGMDYFHHVEELPDSPPMLRLNSQPLQREGYFTDLVAEEAVQFIAANQARPFFLEVAFTAPHAPFQGPNDRLPKPLPADSPLWNQGRAPPAVYGSMIERMDQAVGRLLAALEAGRQAGNTLVVFHSDNGGTASARNAPLSGLKGSTMEGGIRVPCLVRWPGVLPAGVVSEQVGITMDLTASFARAAGIRPPPDQPWDGMDLLGRVAAGQPVAPRALFWRARRGDNTWWAVRDGELKYVRRQQGEAIKEWLFDLGADVAERSDLLAARPDDAQRLKGLLTQWEHQVRPRR